MESNSKNLPIGRGEIYISYTGDTKVCRIRTARHGPRGPVRRVKPIIIHGISQPGDISGVRGVPEDENEPDKQRDCRFAEAFASQRALKTNNNNRFHVVANEGKY
jgi:hypothetical protein